MLSECSQNSLHNFVWRISLRYFSCLLLPVYKMVPNAIFLFPSSPNCSIKDTQNQSFFHCVLFLSFLHLTGQSALLSSIITSKAGEAPEHVKIISRKDAILFSGLSELNMKFSLRESDVSQQFYAIIFFPLFPPTVMILYWCFSAWHKQILCWNIWKVCFGLGKPCNFSRIKSHIY